jgi:hypothetical protein
VQWGVPIGKHEAIAHKLADMAAHTFAMESIAELVGDLADRNGLRHPPRGGGREGVEHGRGWHLIDETLQIRGGRGYETERSLAARGERAHRVERMMRDCAHQQDLRGLERDHAPVHGARGGRQAPRGRRRARRPEGGDRAKLAALPKIAAFYAGGTRRAGSAGAAGPVRGLRASSPSTCASPSA